jgi:hypothetical protein
MSPNKETLPKWLCGGASVGKLAQCSKLLGFPMRAKVNTVLAHSFKSLTAFERMNQGAQFHFRMAHLGRLRKCRI